MNLVEDFVRMGLARFFGIRMHDARIRREHRLLFHCNVFALAASVTAVVSCVSLLAHRHLNDDVDELELEVVLRGKHHQFQQL